MYGESRPLPLVPAGLTAPRLLDRSGAVRPEPLGQHLGGAAALHHPWQPASKATRLQGRCVSVGGSVSMQALFMYICGSEELV